MSMANQKVDFHRKMCCNSNPYQNQANKNERHQQTYWRNKIADILF